MRVAARGGCKAGARVPPRARRGGRASRPLVDEEQLLLRVAHARLARAPARSRRAVCAEGSPARCPGGSPACCCLPARPDTTHAGPQRAAHAAEGARGRSAGGAQARLHQAGPLLPVALLAVEACGQAQQLTAAHRVLACKFAGSDSERQSCSAPLAARTAGQLMPLPQSPTAHDHTRWSKGKVYVAASSQGQRGAVLQRLSRCRSSSQASSPASACSAAY